MSPWTARRASHSSVFHIDAGSSLIIQRDARSMPSSIGSLLVSRGLSQSHDGCLQHDSQIQQQAPIVYIPKIVIYPTLHLFDGTGFTSMAVDLCPSRQARLDVMAERVLGDQFFVFGVVRHGMGARTDERHFSAKHIEELRQFVDA